MIEVAYDPIVQDMKSGLPISEPGWFRYNHDNHMDIVKHSLRIRILGSSISITD